GQAFLVREVSRQQRIDRSRGLADAGLVFPRPIEGLTQGLVIELQDQRRSQHSGARPRWGLLADGGRRTGQGNQERDQQRRRDSRSHGASQQSPGGGLS